MALCPLPSSTYWKTLWMGYFWSDSEQWSGGVCLCGTVGIIVKSETFQREVCPSDSAFLLRRLARLQDRGSGEQWSHSLKEVLPL